MHHLFYICMEIYSFFLSSFYAIYFTYAVEFVVLFFHFFYDVMKLTESAYTLERRPTHN